jgi:hypothetical protein
MFQVNVCINVTVDGRDGCHVMHKDFDLPFVPTRGLVLDTNEELLLTLNVVMWNTKEQNFNCIGSSTETVCSTLEEYNYTLKKFTEFGFTDEGWSEDDTDF